MIDFPKARLQALFAFGIALLAPGACGTTRPFHFEPVMASALFVILLVTALVQPMLSARKPGATTMACTQSRTRSS